MRLLKPFLIIAVLLALFAPGAFSSVRDGAIRMANGTAETSPDQQKTYDRICPLFEVWSDLDRTGRAATARTIRHLAREQAARTEDPALAAFLRVVPDALGAGSAAQTKAARALLRRECRAHGN